MSKPTVTAEDEALTPEWWAEHIAASVWDMPAIETREEFKAALVQAFDALTTAARVEGEARGLERAAEDVRQYADENCANFGQEHFCISFGCGSMLRLMSRLRALAAEEGGEG